MSTLAEWGSGQWSSFEDSSVLWFVPEQVQPDDIVSPVLWLRSDRGITLNGSNVSGWTDLSGEGNNASQATAAVQPAYGIDSGINGHPGITFDASNSEWMDLTGIASASNDWTFIAVLNQGALTGTFQDIMASLVGPTAFASTRTSVDFVGGYDGTSWRSVTAVQLGEQWLEWIWDSSGLTLSVGRDGTILASSAYDGTLPMSGTTALGSYGGGAGQHLNGVLTELIVYDRLLLSNELALVRSYLSARYAL